MSFPPGVCGGLREAKVKGRVFPAPLFHLRQRTALFALLLCSLLYSCAPQDRGSIEGGWESLHDIRKCGTIFKPQLFSGQIVLSGEEEIYDTRDGHFKIHYTLSGEDAIDPTDSLPEDGVPDYIAILEEGLKDAWQEEVVNLNWKPPPSDGSFGGDSRYDVFAKKCLISGSSCFGAAHTLSWTPGQGWSSYIVIDPKNTTALGWAVGDIPRVVKGVCLHEFNHACQFAYNVSFSGGWWMENCADWIEFEIYDFLKDLTPAIDVLLSWRFGENNKSVFSTDGRYEYYNFIWPKFIVDSRGHDLDIIRRIWERAAQGPPSKYTGFLGTINDILAEDGGGLIEDFQRFTEWNYISCAHDDGAHYFRGAFPTTPYGSVEINSVHALYPTAVTQANTLIYPLGASYLQFVPDPNFQDFGISFTGEAGTQWGLSLVLQRPTCEYITSEYIVPGSGTTSTTIQNMNEYMRIILIVQNLETASFLPGKTFTCTAAASGARTPGPSLPSPSLERIGLFPTEITLSPGDVEQFGAIGVNDDCTRVNLTRDAAWSLSSPKVASIDRWGKLTALSPGTAIIQAEKDGVLSAAAKVNVIGEPQKTAHLVSRGWGCQASPAPLEPPHGDAYFPLTSFPQGVSRLWGGIILALAAIVLVLGMRWRKRITASIIPQARRVALYQEIAWRVVLLFSLLDFSYIHISQETKYFPWPNLLGFLLLCFALFLFRRGMGQIKKVRFPNHLASMMWVTGFYLALSCGFALIFLVIFLLPTYFYRMDIEDDALKESRKEEYTELMEKTERLIPWIY